MNRKFKDSQSDNDTNDSDVQNQANNNVQNTLKELQREINHMNSYSHELNPSDDDSDDLQPKSHPSDFSSIPNSSGDIDFSNDHHSDHPNSFIPKERETPRPNKKISHPKVVHKLNHTNHDSQEVLTKCVNIALWAVMAIILLGALYGIYVFITNFQP